MSLHILVISFTVHEMHPHKPLIRITPGIRGLPLINAKGGGGTKHGGGESRMKIRGHKIYHCLMSNKIGFIEDL